MNFVERFKAGEPIESDAITPGFYFYGKKIPTPNDSNVFFIKDTRTMMVIKVIIDKDSRIDIVPTPEGKRVLELDSYSETQQSSAKINMGGHPINVVFVNRCGELIVSMVKGSVIVSGTRVCAVGITDSIIKNKITDKDIVGGKSIKCDRFDENLIHAREIINSHLYGYNDWGSLGKDGKDEDIVDKLYISANCDNREE